MLGREASHRHLAASWRSPSNPIGYFYANHSRQSETLPLRRFITAALSYARNVRRDMVKEGIAFQQNRPASIGFVMVLFREINNVANMFLN
jgi:hypothetical protein